MKESETGRSAQNVNNSLRKRETKRDQLCVYLAKWSHILSLSWPYVASIKYSTVNWPIEHVTAKGRSYIGF